MNSPWRWRCMQRPMTVPSSTAERGEQGCRAVVLVVRHGLTVTRFDRQPGLGAIESLDLALLIKRKDHGMSRRTDLETDDVGELGGKAGIARAQPMGRLVGRLGAGQRLQSRRGFACNRRFARLAGPVTQQAVDPGLDKVLLPPPHRRPADPEYCAPPLAPTCDRPRPARYAPARGRLRSATIAANRSRSSALTTTHTEPWPHHSPLLV
jgi:hypothetical protein